MIPQKCMDCFRLLLEHLAWIEHQFLSGIRDSRASVRDDERCGRNKEVRTPELIGQIKNFMDKDLRVSIEISAQFDVSVGTVHTIIRSELKMRKNCTKFSQGCSEMIRKKDVVMTAGRWLSWSIQIPQFLMLWWPVMKAGSTDMTKRQNSQWKHAGSPRLKKARQSKSTHKLLMIPFFDSTGMIYMHWVPTGQTVNKEYYVEVLTEFRKRFLGKRPALFKSAQWHFHQDNAPVHNSILVTDYLTKMGIKTVPHPPYSAELGPCDFWLFPKLRGCRYETIEEMKEAVMKVIDTVTQEDFHGAFQKLLERYNKCIAARGDYFKRD